MFINFSLVVLVIILKYMQDKTPSQSETTFTSKSNVSSSSSGWFVSYSQCWAVLTCIFWSIRETEQMTSRRFKISHGRLELSATIVGLLLVYHPTHWTLLRRLIEEIVSNITRKLWRHGWGELICSPLWVLYMMLSNHRQWGMKSWQVNCLYLSNLLLSPWDFCCVI